MNLDSFFYLPLLAIVLSLFFICKYFYKIFSSIEKGKDTLLKTQDFLKEQEPSLKKGREFVQNEAKREEEFLLLKKKLKIN